MHLIRARILMVTLGLLLSGCSLQPREQVRIREDRAHYTKLDAKPTAAELAPYAALAAVVYDGSFNTIEHSPRLGIPCDQLTRKERRDKNVKDSVKKCLVLWECAL